MGGLEQRDVEAFNRWMCVSRLRVASAVVLLAVVCHQFGIGQVRLAPIVAAAAATAAVSILGLVRRAGLHRRRAFLLGQLLLGVLATTLGILFGTDGLTALLARPLYVTMIVPAGLLSVPLGFAIATVATVVHAGLLVAHVGWSAGALASPEFIIPTALFYVVAQQCFFYGRHLEGKNAALRAVSLRLAESQQRIAAQGRLSAELAAAGRTLSDTLATPDPLADVSRTIRERLAADWAAVFRVDGETFALAAASGPGPEPSDVARLDLPLTTWPALVRLADARAIRLDGDEAAATPPALTGDRTLGTVLLAALYRTGTMIGFLAVGYREAPVDADAWAVPVLGGLSEHATIAFLNARLLEEVREASALKSEFVAAVSHELRSPLNVVLGYQEMLLEEGLGPLTPPQADAIRRSQTHTVMLLEMITALLDLNRFEAGRLPVQCEPVAIPAFLREVCDELPESWRRRDVAVRVVVDTTLPPVDTDRAKLKTVVRNLVHNALKFTERGSVTLGAALTADGELALSVADTGCGIPADALVYVFDMFRQVPGTAGGGVGLGLHIVRRLTDALGAAIRIRSDVGRGTCFTITLPRTGAIAAPASAAHRADAA
jgi:signal transduction histidine kinase